MIPTKNLLRVIRAMTMIQTLPEVEDVEDSEEVGEAQEEERDEATLLVAETLGARDLEMTWTVRPAG